MTTPRLPELLTTREVAEILRCTEWTVRKYLNRRELRGVRSGSSWLIKPEWLEEYLMQGDNQA